MPTTQSSGRISLLGASSRLLTASLHALLRSVSSMAWRTASRVIQYTTTSMTAIAKIWTTKSKAESIFSLSKVSAYFFAALIVQGCTSFQSSTYADPSTSPERHPVVQAACDKGYYWCSGGISAVWGRE